MVCIYLKGTAMQIGVEFLNSKNYCEAFLIDLRVSALCIIKRVQSIADRSLCPIWHYVCQHRSDTIWTGVT